MSFRGRIILSVIGAIAIRTVLNKDVRYLVRTYRKYFGKKKEENKENAPIPAGAEQKAV